MPVSAILVLSTIVHCEQTQSDHGYNLGTAEFDGKMSRFSEAHSVACHDYLY